MASPTIDFQRKKGYFHSSGKTITESTQNVFESVRRSGHNTKSDEVWSDTITYCADVATADAFTLANPTIVRKYTNVSLTVEPGSNGQAMYIDDGGVFVRPWIAPTDITDAANMPSIGFQIKMYQGPTGTNPGQLITPSEGRWIADYYSGMVMFDVGFTANDLGWGTPTVDIYIYIGSTLSGGGKLTIEDEHNLVGTTSVLNFIGADVVAKPGTGKINVYIPTPDYVSHFNTGDGNNSAVAGGITTVNRHVSSPTAVGNPFDIGGWVAGSLQSCHNSGIVNIITAGSSSFLDNLTTTLTVSVYGADGVTVIATHNLVVVGDANTSANGITIDIANFGPDTDQYRGDISVDLDMTTILPNGGRYSYTVEHNDAGDGIFTFSQNDLFYDIDDTAATTSIPTIIESAGNTYRQVSGVYNFTTGNQFTVNIADIDNINSDSYPGTVVEILGGEYALPNLNLTVSDLTGWTVSHDNLNASYSKNDWAISVAQYCDTTTTGSISSGAKDWTDEAKHNSVNSSFVINTYTDNSTAIYEDFRLETRRFTSGGANWDSSQDLTTYDGGTVLQYSCSRLIYPSLDYALYEPNVSNQPDYSGVSGDKVAYLEFHNLSTTYQNGLLQFGDTNVSEALLSSDDVMVEISLDFINWYTLNDDYVGGTLANGDGCRINPGSHNMGGDQALEFTLGSGGTTGVGTGNTNNGIWVRITFTDTSNAYIGEIGISNWV